MDTNTSNLGHTAPPRRRAQTVKMTDLRFALTNIVGKVKYAGERYVVTSMGQPQVGIVSLEDLDRLDALDAAQAAEAAEAAEAAPGAKEVNEGSLEPQRAVA